MSEKLKPCARCGKAQLIDNDQDCGRGPARYSVVCDCPEWFDTEADAIAAWNRRDDRKLVETEQLLEIANHAAANALYERDRWRALALEAVRVIDGLLERLGSDIYDADKVAVEDAETFKSRAAGLMVDSKVATVKDSNLPPWEFLLGVEQS
jgi:hypothetical protein